MIAVWVGMAVSIELTDTAHIGASVVIPALAVIVLAAAAQDLTTYRELQDIYMSAISALSQDQSLPEYWRLIRTYASLPAAIILRDCATRMTKKCRLVITEES